MGNSRMPAKSGLFRAIRIVMMLIVASLASSCQKDKTVRLPGGYDAGAVSESNALEEVRNFVAVGPRPSGSDGARKAYDFINRRLDQLKIVPVIYQFTESLPQGKITFRNITGAIPGTTSNAIMIVSHFDTYAPAGDSFVGADDSGSSTGLLLELARLFSQTNHAGPDIVIAFVDGEECRRGYSDNDGLHGSRYLAETLARRGELSRYKAVIVLDMVGDKNLSVTIPRNSSTELVSMLFDATHEENARQFFSLAKGDIIDDHVPFLQRGVPAIDIIDLEYGSAPCENDYWHTTADTMDKLSAESLGIVGRVTVRLVNKLLAEYGATAR
jgi:glutaminyl-peptide cyclotransferase